MSQIRIHARPDAIAAGYADYAADVSAKVFDSLEEYFDFPYPLPETGLNSLIDELHVLRQLLFVVVV